MRVKPKRKRYHELSVASILNTHWKLRVLLKLETKDEREAVKVTEVSLGTNSKADCRRCLTAERLNDIWHQSTCRRGNPLPTKRAEEVPAQSRASLPAHKSSGPIPNPLLHCIPRARLRCFRISQYHPLPLLAPSL